MGGEKIEERNYTKEEYFDLCLRSEWKYEFHDGRIVAMAGGNPPHNQAKRNVYNHLLLNVKGCHLYDSDTAVRIKDLNRYYYPDVSLVCDKPEIDKNAGIETLLNPELLVEVQSTSTDGKDRGEKLEAYKLISGLKEYILVDSKQYLVQTYYRNDERSWRIGSYYRLDQVVKIITVNLEVPMSVIYNQVIAV